MKTVILVVGVILWSASANAACFGSKNFQTCSDESGNSYTVQRLGNTTIMNGSNYSTGSNWSQQSTTFGKTTIHNGIDADGDAWSSTCFNGQCN
jgi:hypothetical protein